MEICQSCLRPAPTVYVEFYQNIGALVIRFTKTAKGHFCRECISQYFWSFTLTTLFLGWWGVISFFVTLFILPNNVIRYLLTLGLPAAGPTIPLAASPHLSGLPPSTPVEPAPSRSEPATSLSSVRDAVPPKVPPERPHTGASPNPIVVGAVALVVSISFIGVVMGALSDGSSSSVLATPVPVLPSRTARRAPTVTPRAVAPTPAHASSAPSCTPWSDVSLAHAGAHMCVYGDVYRTYDDGQAYFVAFSSSPDAFYLLSYDIYLPDLRPGDCIRAVGEINHLGNAPVMVLGWTSEVADCY